MKRSDEGRGGTMTRRSFLRRTLVGATLIGLGGTLARHLTGYHLDEREAAALRILSPKEAIVLGAIARRMLAADRPGAPSPDEIGVVGAADRYLGALPDALASDLKALLHLVEHTPFLFALRPARFTRLDPAAQDAVLDGWARSRLTARRQGFAALKSLVMFGYYGDPRTFVVPGWPGPMLPQAPIDAGSAGGAGDAGPTTPPTRGRP